MVLASGGPARPLLMYAGLDASGIYSSADGGLHWVATGWSGPGRPLWPLTHEIPQHLFVRAPYERIYESQDGGLNWRSRWAGMDFSTQVISVALDGAHPGTLYAGGTEGFFRSLDGAASWQPVGPELAGQTVFAITLDPAGDDVL